jgi:hypothetical protein
MARRKYHDKEKIDPEVTQTPTIDMDVLEIKGQGKKWHLFYPDPSNYQTPVPIIKDGQVIGSANSWIATNKMIEVHEVFSSPAAAREAAEFIHPGCTIKITNTSKKKARRDDDDGGS